MRYQITDAIREVENRINSGALLQVEMQGHRLAVTAVEASAASHVSPQYPHAAEAPRYYGERINTRIERLLAIEWIIGVLTGERSPVHGYEADARHTLQQACAQYQERGKASRCKIEA